jgi:nucleoid-associated protein YgaU
MALALNTHPVFRSSGVARYRRPTHLRLVVAEPIHHKQSHRVSASVYRRRRVGAAIAALGLLAVAMFGLIGVFKGSARADEHVANRASTPHTVIAQSGDTLWAIARRIAPVGSITGLVDQLVMMNGDEIVAGQEIRLP